ncbi:hypothetical protein P7C73_g5025, partial [Tremellales sp. Uapishka_1]
MLSFSSLAASLLFATSALQPVLAGIYMTSPVATTVGNGGQVLTVKWADDGNSPSLASVGPCSIDLYTGSQLEQTQLQNLAASVDVSKANTVSATIDPSVGQAGKYYFVRFSSLSLKQTTNPTYPYEAFSAQFQLDTMTGTFNSTVLAQLAASNTTVSSVSSVVVCRSLPLILSSANTSQASATSHAASVTPKAASATSKAAAAASSSSKSSTSGSLPQVIAPASLAAVVGFATYLLL